MKNQINGLAPRKRFTTLDAMRGFAAIFVVLVHYGYNVGGYTPQLALLAVDVFFVMSGFVISYNYDDKLLSGTLKKTSFMSKRFERLAPLYLAGFILGLAVQYMFHADGLYGVHLLGSAVLNLFGFPAVFFVSPSASLFPINHPFWSLFFELWVANLIYALCIRWVRGARMAIVLFMSAVGLIFLGIKYQGLSGGYSLHTISLGFCRVIFSFYAGVAVCRLYRLRRTRIPVSSLFILGTLVVALMLPLSEKNSALVQAGIIILLFPVLTYFGASARAMPSRLGELLGDGSYAVYALHYPFLIVALHFLGRPLHAHLLIGQIVFATLMVAVGAPAAKLDEILRKGLRGRLTNAKPSPPAFSDIVVDL